MYLYFIHHIQVQGPNNCLKKCQNFTNSFVAFSPPKKLWCPLKIKIPMVRTGRWKGVKVEIGSFMTKNWSKVVGNDGKLQETTFLDRRAHMGAKNPCISPRGWWRVKWRVKWRVTLHPPDFTLHPTPGNPAHLLSLWTQDVENYQNIKFYNIRGYFQVFKDALSIGDA